MGKGPAGEALFLHSRGEEKVKSTKKGERESAISFLPRGYAGVLHQGRKERKKDRGKLLLSATKGGGRVFSIEQKTRTQLDTVTIQAILQGSGGERRKGRWGMTHLSEEEVARMKDEGPSKIAHGWLLYLFWLAGT